jgi:hypothetical protein
MCAYRNLIVLWWWPREAAKAVIALLLATQLTACGGSGDGGGEMADLCSAFSALTVGVGELGSVTSTPGSSDIWQFVPPASRNYTISLTHGGGAADFHTRVFDDCATGAGSSVSFSGPLLNCNPLGPGSDESCPTPNLTAGNGIFSVVGDDASEGGSYTLRID